jgi:hypothetical protein
VVGALQEVDALCRPATGEHLRPAREARARHDRGAKSPDEALRLRQAVLVPADHHELFVATRRLGQCLQSGDFGVASQTRREPCDRRSYKRCRGASVPAGIDHDLRRRERARAERFAEEVEPAH